MAGTSCTRPATFTTWSWLRVAVPAATSTTCRFWIATCTSGWRRSPGRSPIQCWILRSPTGLAKRWPRPSGCSATPSSPDGYLDSHFQVRFPGERFVQLQWGHELYCAGHLIQAAVALHRTTGDSRLLEVARRVADLRRRHVRARRRARSMGSCGHPEIETALVELYRETGAESYLGRARYFVDRRGHGLLDDGRFGPHYWQDHLPVRDARSVEGHAVRQLYLVAGVADVYMRDRRCQPAQGRWSGSGPTMVGHQDLPDRGHRGTPQRRGVRRPVRAAQRTSYCETCAAIASIMLLAGGC